MEILVDIMQQIFLQGNCFLPLEPSTWRNWSWNRDNMVQFNLSASQRMELICRYMGSGRRSSSWTTSHIYAASLGWTDETRFDVSSCRERYGAGGALCSSDAWLEDTDARTLEKCAWWPCVSLMLEWELCDAKWVAKSMSVHSETVKVITLCR